MVIRIYSEASTGPMIFYDVTDIDVSVPEKISFKHTRPGASEQSTAMFFTATIVGASLDPA